MGFNRIRTKYDFEIPELFKKIFQEIQKVSKSEGFPYIEHDIGEVLYYKNYDEKPINNLKQYHKNQDLENGWDLLKDEMRVFKKVCQ